MFKFECVSKSIHSMNKQFSKLAFKGGVFSHVSLDEEFAVPKSYKMGWDGMNGTGWDEKICTPLDKHLPFLQK